ncbi:MAG: hypothetical protein VSS75_004290 [Candidatus Parabeggiatoa sp.]|nr:hypothetical protein [Candidatus Parabeggiatoa sp.]
MDDIVIIFALDFTLALLPPPNVSKKEYFETYSLFNDLNKQKKLAWLRFSFQIYFALLGVQNLFCIAWSDKNRE